MHTSDSMNSMNSLLRKRVGVGHRLIFVQDFFFRFFCLCEFVRKRNGGGVRSVKFYVNSLLRKKVWLCGTQTHFFKSTLKIRQKNFESLIALPKKFKSEKTQKKPR